MCKNSEWDVSDLYHGIISASRRNVEGNHDKMSVGMTGRPAARQRLKPRTCVPATPAVCNASSGSTGLRAAAGLDHCCPKSIRCSPVLCRTLNVFSISEFITVITKVRRWATSTYFTPIPISHKGTMCEVTSSNLEAHTRNHARELSWYTVQERDKYVWPGKSCPFCVERIRTNIDIKTTMVISSDPVYNIPHFQI